MAADTVVHIGENSPQQVAYKLMTDIMTAEHVSLYADHSSSEKRADRAYIFNLYYECMRAVGGMTPK